MSISSVFFTNKGRILQSKCMLGKPLNFTKIIIGDGELNGKVIQELETLLSPKLEIPITRLVTVDTAKVKIGGKFNNSNLANGFYYRELGLFATDPDSNVETLYCYGNASNLAEYISGQGSEIIEKQIEIIAVVGNEANVTATINDSLLSVSPEDLEAHNNDANAHAPIRTWITNLFANLMLPWSKITEKPSTYPPSTHSHAWDSITGKPSSFNPSTHSHNDVTITTSGYMSAADKVKLNGIATNANNYVHPGNGTNPHGTTKEDVGLGSVKNYSVASLADAKAGTSNVLYMTPYLVKEACKMYGGDYMGKDITFQGLAHTILAANAGVDATIWSTTGSGIAVIKMFHFLGSSSSGISHSGIEIIVDGVVKANFPNSTNGYDGISVGKFFKSRNSDTDGPDDTIIPFESSIQVIIRKPTFTSSNITILFDVVTYKNK